MEQMAIPSVWPMRGAVVKAASHWFSRSTVFPPPGMLLELSVSVLPLQEHQLSNFKRLNLDTILLGWLWAWRAAMDDAERSAEFATAAGHILCRFNVVNNEDEAVLFAYQVKEDEERAADVLGHSLLTRARELTSLQETNRTASLL